MRRLPLFAILLLAAAPISSGADSVHCTDPPFDLQLPAEWAPHPHKPDGVAWAWVRDLPDGSRLAILIEIKTEMLVPENLLDDPPDRLRRRMGDIPADAVVRARRVDWQGNSINVIDLEETSGGFPLYSTRAFVPLKGESIQLSVVGPRTAQSDARLELGRALAALHGEAAWKSGIADSTSFWVLLAVCCSGYIGALVYGLFYLAVFRWVPDGALKLRLGWQIANVVLIFVMVLLSQILSFCQQVFGHSGKSDSGQGELLLPALFSIPILLSVQRLKARLRALEPVLPKPMPVFPAAAGTAFEQLGPLGEEPKVPPPGPNSPPV